MAEKLAKVTASQDSIESASRRPAPRGSLGRRRVCARQRPPFLRGGRAEGWAVRSPKPGAACRGAWCVLNTASNVVLTSAPGCTCSRAHTSPFLARASVRPCPRPGSHLDILPFPAQELRRDRRAVGAAARQSGCDTAARVAVSGERHHPEEPQEGPRVHQRVLQGAAQTLCAARAPSMSRDSSRREALTPTPLHHARRSWRALCAAC